MQTKAKKLRIAFSVIFYSASIISVDIWGLVWYYGWWISVRVSTCDDLDLRWLNYLDWVYKKLDVRLNFTTGSPIPDLDYCFSA